MRAPIAWATGPYGRRSSNSLSARHHRFRQQLKSAITSGRDKAAKDGFGAFNPGVRVTPDGRIVFGRSTTSPTYPNIQFWDYVQRDLKDMATKVEGRENDKAATLNGLHHDLNAELDRLFPNSGRRGKVRIRSSRRKTPARRAASS